MYWNQLGSSKYQNYLECNNHLCLFHDLHISTQYLWIHDWESARSLTLQCYIRTTVGAVLLKYFNAPYSKGSNLEFMSFFILKRNCQWSWTKTRVRRSDTENIPRKQKIRSIVTNQIQNSSFHSFIVKSIMSKN